MTRKEIKPFHKPFGFWFSLHEPTLPRPVASIFNNETPMRRLRALEELIVSLDPKSEEGQRIGYRGWSSCRVCQKVNGSQEYVYTKNGVTYRWPSGLMHYLEDHSIEPPDELRELVDYHELEFKIVRENPTMELFPFNLYRAQEDGDIVELWRAHRPSGTMWNSISAQILSPTKLHLCVRAEGIPNPVFDQEIETTPDVLASIVRERKYSMACEEYKERERARRDYEIRRLVKLMFGEE